MRRASSWASVAALVLPAVSGTPAAGQGDLPADKAGLDGIYACTELRRRLNVRTGNFEFITVHHHYFFRPDGAVYEGLPLGGPASFDWKTAREKTPDRVGTYRIDDKQIRFKWTGAAQPETEAFSRSDPDRIQIGKLRLQRLHLGDADLRLDGEFVRSNVINFSGPPGSDAVGSIASEHRIAFDKDGRFRERGLLAYFDSAATASGSASHPDGVSTTTGSQKTAGSGTYRIGNGTLELTYDDGRRRRLLFFVFPQYAGDSRPGQIFLDGTGLLREGK